MVSQGERPVDRPPATGKPARRPRLPETAPALDADEVADVFKALSTPVRVQLLWLLGKGEACVNDLTEGLGVTQPTVSFHLKVLANAGLVLGERRGALVWCALVPTRFDEVVAMLIAARDGEPPA